MEQITPHNPCIKLCFFVHPKPLTHPSRSRAYSPSNTQILPMYPGNPSIHISPVSRHPAAHVTLFPPMAQGRALRTQTHPALQDSWQTASFTPTAPHPQQRRLSTSQPTLHPHSSSRTRLDRLRSHASPAQNRRHGRRYQSPQREDSLQQVHGLHLLDS